MKQQGFTDSYGQTLAIDTQPAPANQGGQSAVAVRFPGINPPSTDMEAVRDGRRSTLQGYLVDLSTARSLAAGTALTLQVQGNLFYADPLFDLVGNSQAGIARVHFQDVNSNPVGTYVTALPSALYKVPFTQLAVENFAQAGKYLYLVYGTDVDILPGASQQVQATIIGTPTVGGSLGALAQQLIGGVNELVVMERGYTYGAKYASVTNLAAGGSEAVFAPGANVNGAIVWSASFMSHTAGTASAVMLAKNAAPGTMIDGDPIVAMDKFVLQVGGVSQMCAGVLPRPVFIAAGKGLYRYSNSLETVSYGAALYTLL